MGNNRRGYAAAAGTAVPEIERYATAIEGLDKSAPENTAVDRSSECAERA
jgi:hypothetical protein